MKLCPKCHKQFSDDANFCPVDAARLAPLESQSVAADTITAKFDLGDRLGGARTGAVQRAVDKATGQPAVVKIIAPAVVALPGLAQRLERELKQLERVQSAGVAKVLASGKRGEDTWLALELLEGAQTLGEAIAARGPIELDVAAHLIEVIGEALIEAAQVGVVHRDLAPKNVLFAGNDIKLINFSLPVPGDKAPGVAEFVAPEQADGKPVDQRSNLFSLGALYYYVLTGQAVQHDETGALRPPSAFTVVPPAVEAVIVRALDRSPTKRFLTVRQFVDEVGRVARGEADPKSTQAMGRSGKPRAELVQTLLGVRGAGMTSAIAAVTPQVEQRIAADSPGSQTLPDALPPVHQQTLVDPPVHAPPVHAQTLIDPLPPAHVVDTGPTQLASGASSVPSTFAGVVAPPLTTSPSAAAALEIAPPGAPTLIGPAMPEPLPPQQLSPDRSPWAPPATLAPNGATDHPLPTAREAPPIAREAPPITAPVAVSAATVPAPLLAAPVLPAAAGGKKAKESKGKFRETMWFKKGELDAEAAEAAAVETAKTGKTAQDKADLLPIDERYKDDGTLSRSDKEKYSLRTGATMMTAAIRDSGTHSHLGKVSEDALIDEMKGGRNKIFALIGVGLVVLILIIVLVVR